MTDSKKGVVPVLMQDPYANEATQGFWDNMAKGILSTTECTKCGTCILVPAPRCFNCQNDQFRWKELPGTGTIYTFTIIRHPLRPDLVDVVPYVGAVVELDGTQGAGSRVGANIINCDVDKVRIGDKVKVVFHKISDTYTVPRFEPA